jgi:hypothetical protein
MSSLVHFAVALGVVELKPSGALPQRYEWLAQSASAILPTYLHARTSDLVLTFLAVRDNRLIGIRQCKLHCVAAIPATNHGLHGALASHEPAPASNQYVGEFIWTKVQVTGQGLGPALADAADGWLRQHGVHFASGFFDASNKKGFGQLEKRKGAQLPYTVDDENRKWYVYQL